MKTGEEKAGRNGSVHELALPRVRTPPQLQQLKGGCGMVRKGFGQVPDTESGNGHPQGSQP